MKCTSPRWGALLYCPGSAPLTMLLYDSQPNITLLQGAMFCGADCVGTAGVGPQQQPREFFKFLIFVGLNERQSRQIIR